MDAKLQKVQGPSLSVIVICLGPGLQESSLLGCITTLHRKGNKKKGNKNKNQDRVIFALHNII